MKRIELTESEAERLAVILQSYLSELRMEIADTERIIMRTSMKEEELFINDLLARLKNAEQDTSP